MSNPIHGDASEPLEFRPPTNAFLQGAPALPFAEEYGALVHIGDSPCLSWPKAQQMVEQGDAGANVWLPAEPEWPAFALRAAFNVAVESGQSVCVLASSDLGCALAGDLLVELSHSLNRFELRQTWEGLTLSVTEGLQPFFIRIECVPVPSFSGAPWLPAMLRADRAETSRAMGIYFLDQVLCRLSEGSEAVLEEACFNFPRYLTHNCQSLTGRVENG